MSETRRIVIIMVEWQRVVFIIHIVHVLHYKKKKKEYITKKILYINCYTQCVLICMFSRNSIDEINLLMIEKCDFFLKFSINFNQITFSMRSCRQS